MPKKFTQKRIFHNGKQQVTLIIERLRIFLAL